MIAILSTFLLTSILALLVNVNPMEAGYYFVIKPLSGRTSALEVLVKMTPLALTGVAVAFAFAGGYFNIGAGGNSTPVRRLRACICMASRLGWPCPSCWRRALWRGWPGRWFQRCSRCVWASMRW